MADEEVYLERPKRDDKACVTRAVRQKGKLWIDVGYTHGGMTLDEDEARQLYADLGQVIAQHDKARGVELRRVGRVEVSYDGGPWGEVDASAIGEVPIDIDTSKIAKHEICYRIHWEET